jgi:hypothetical protein
MRKEKENIKSQVVGVRGEPAREKFQVKITLRMEKN